MIGRTAGLGAVLALGAAIVLTGPAPAAEAAACSGSSGVTVVVDFGALGGIQVGCAAGDPSTGLSAMHSAGFATTGTQHDGPGFVCRINGAPASDPCVRTPPTTAYWSYWHASRGGSWSYSSLGAAGYNPAPGTVEGWSYGAGARPGIAPPAAPAPPAPPPAPKPTTKPAPRPTTNPPAPPRTSDPGAPRAPGVPAASGGGGPSPSAGVPTAPGVTTSGRPPAGASTAPSTSAGASGTVASTGVAGAPATEDPGPPSTVATEPVSSDSSRQALGASVLGGALILGLGTAAFLIARRRKAPG